MRKKQDTSKRTRQKSFAQVLPLPKRNKEFSNKLFYGDNLEILRKYIKDESVDLCYIDPPFNSKRNYNQIYNNIAKIDKAQAQAFVDTWTWDTMAEQGFVDIVTNERKLFPKATIDLIIAFKQVLGASDLTAYLISITLRVAEIHRVLKETGSFYFHCDPTASHYLKLVLDSVFCSQGGDFKNEIIWHYKKWSVKQPQFVSNHDVIFFYTKSLSKDRTFNQLFMPRALSTLKRFGSEKIVSGYDESGKRMPSTTTGENSEGVAMDDVWDIGRVPPVKQLYPTQKPDTLLERIITVSSEKGDVILDAYCGCGTTIMIAEKLERKWIGIDITYQSISLILKRLEETYRKASLDKVGVSGMPEDFESAEALANKSDDRTRKEFEKWAVLTYSNNRAVINEKKGRDGGIDGVAFILDRNNKGDTNYKEIVFSVKSNKTLSPSVIRDLNGTIEREGAVMGILITLYPMSNLVKESKKYGKYKNAMFEQTYDKIQVINIEEILNGERMNIPIALEVTKSVQQKGQNIQQELSF